VLVFEPQVGHLGELAQAGLARLDRQRGLDDRRVDGAALQRGQALGGWPMSTFCVAALLESF